MSSNDEYLVLTVKEVAEQLRIKPGTVYEWWSRGIIPGFQPAGKHGAIRVPKNFLETWKLERPSNVPQDEVTHGPTPAWMDFSYPS